MTHEIFTFAGDSKIRVMLKNVPPRNDVIITAKEVSSKDVIEDVIIINSSSDNDSEFIERNEDRNISKKSNEVTHSLGVNVQPNYALNDDYYGLSAMDDRFIKDYYETLRQNQIQRDKTASNLKRQAIYENSGILKSNKISCIRFHEDVKSELSSDSDAKDILKSVIKYVGDSTTSEVSEEFEP